MTQIKQVSLREVAFLYQHKGSLRWNSRYGPRITIPLGRDEHTARSLEASFGGYVGCRHKAFRYELSGYRAKDLIEAIYPYLYKDEYKAHAKEFLDSTILELYRPLVEETYEPITDKTPLAFRNAEARPQDKVEKEEKGESPMFWFPPMAEEDTFR